MTSKHSVQPKLRCPIHLILDFDDTLTTKDTTTILGSVSEKAKSCWKDVVDTWVNAFEAFKKQPFDWDDYGPAEFSRWLDARKPVEEASVQRAQDCGMFVGVTDDDIATISRNATTGEDHIMRAAWFELLDTVRTSKDIGGKVSILSANWSESFVRRVLYYAAQRSNPVAFDSGMGSYVNDMDILANEIHGLGSPKGSSGRVMRPFGLDIRISGDKVRYFDLITSSQSWTAAHRAGFDRPVTIYVGDSPTDFGCLCRADVGIWLCDIPEHEVPAKFQERFKPLKVVPPASLTSLQDVAAAELRGKLDANRTLFYWAPDLQTIINFMAGIDK